METGEKIKEKKFLGRRFWQGGLVLLAVFFVFISSSTSASAKCFCATHGNKDGQSLSFTYNIVGDPNGYDVNSSSECKEKCKSLGVDYYSNSTPMFWIPVGSAVGTAVKEVKADTYKAMTEGIGLVFKILLYGVFQFLVWLLGIAATIFAWVIDPKNVSFIMNNQGVYASWAMVRDFLNLGFILVLLYIAFCVIFQIGSYSDGWKKMLLMMVIMALLVNFSFPISRFIIDVSNIAFYYLLNSGFSGLSSGSAIISNFSNDAGLGVLLKETSESSGIPYLLSMIIFTFILGLTFFVIAVLFVVRMVAIGILIIFSPIGFTGAAFPFSKKYASQWWDNLFKYAFFAPIMIFMIIIAGKIMKFSSSDSMIKAMGENLGPNQDPNFLGTAAFFTIPIVILWFGMHMAQTMSIAGASAVTGMADKAAKWVGKNFTGQAGLGGLAAHWANRSLANTKYGKFVSPMALKAAYQARSKRLDEEALAKSTGGIENKMNRIVDWASTANPYFLAKRLKRGLRDKKAGLSFKEGFMADFDKVDYDFIKRQQTARKEEKEIAEVSENSDYVIRRAKQALDNGNFEEFHGAIMNLAKNNNINDLMYGDLGRKFGSKGVMDPILAKNVLKQMYKEAGADEKTAARNLSIISGIGEGKGNLALSGWSEMDGKTGDFKITSDDKQANIALAKWGEMEPQERQKKLHKDGLFTTIYADGKVKIAGIGSVQSKIFENMDGGDIKQSERTRTDTSKMISRFAQREDMEEISDEIKKEINDKLKVDLSGIRTELTEGLGKDYVKAVDEFVRNKKKPVEKKEASVNISNGSSGSSGSGSAGTEEMGGDDD